MYHIVPTPPWAPQTSAYPRPAWPNIPVQPAWPQVDMAEWYRREAEALRRENAELRKENFRLRERLADRREDFRLPLPETW